MSIRDREVWVSILGGGKYHCTVLRTKPYQGLLEVIDISRDLAQMPCYQEDVSLSYDARPRPDPNDVAQWQDMVAKFIDERSSTMQAPSSSP